MTPEQEKYHNQMGMDLIENKELNKANPSINVLAEEAAWIDKYNQEQMSKTDSEVLEWKKMWMRDRAPELAKLHIEMSTVDPEPMWYGGGANKQGYPDGSKASNSWKAMTPSKVEDLDFNGEPVVKNNLYGKYDLNDSITNMKYQVGDFPRTSSADELREKIYSHPAYTQEEIDLVIDVKKETNPKDAFDKGLKYDDEKCAYHLLPPYALEGTAWIFKYGGVKYEDWNHSKGMSWSKMYRAALGHTLDLGKARSNDTETNVNHVFHAICSLMMLAENMIMHPENNDLYPKEYEIHRERIEAFMTKTRENALKAIKDLKKDQ